MSSRDSKSTSGTTVSRVGVAATDGALRCHKSRSRSRLTPKAKISALRTTAWSSGTNEAEKRPRCLDCTARPLLWILERILLQTCGDGSPPDTDSLSAQRIREPTPLSFAEANVCRDPCLSEQFVGGLGLEFSFEFGTQFLTGIMQPRLRGAHRAIQNLCDLAQAETLQIV